MSDVSLRAGFACLVWLAVAVLSVSAGSAMAAVGFDGLLDSSGTGIHAALRNLEIGGVAAFVVDGGAVTRNPDCPQVNEDGGRRYISTVASDFNECDFVATFTYTANPGGTGDGSGFYVFFGFGSGEPSRYFCEPDAALIFALNSHTRSDTGAWVGYRPENGDSAVNSMTAGLAGWNTAVPFGTQGRLEIAKTGDSITFSWDADNSGEFDCWFTIDHISELYPDFNNTNSRLFFGTGGTLTTFDGLTVQIIPEPATMTLLALGGLAMLRRRRTAKL